jgi:protease-4
MDRIGVRSYTIKSGQLKDMGSLFKPMTPAERQVIQDLIDQYFARFRTIVQMHRRLSEEQTTAVTDGRVFSGEQAMALKLVDQLGTLEDALDLARAKADACSAKAVLYIRPYGHGGSIYAQNQLPAPEARGNTTLRIPGLQEMMPPGFYYMWEP